MKLHNPLFALTVIAMTLGATAAHAALSPELERWTEGPARYLMTREEQKEWQSITTDDEAKAFIELFWAKRDPDLKKPGNPFLAMFQALVKYANDNVAEPATPGWMTDRGKVLILLGPPSRITSTGLRSDDASLMKPPRLGNADRDTRDLPTQSWIYEKDRRPSFSKRTVEIIFSDPLGGERFQFDRRRTKVNIDDLLERAAEKGIAHPELKSVPQP